MINIFLKCSTQLFLLITIGCSLTKKASSPISLAPLKKKEAHKIKEKINLINTPFHSFLVNGKLILPLNEDTYSIKVLIKGIRDSLLIFSAMPFAGIEMFRGILTNDSAILINRKEKVYTILALKPMFEKIGHEFFINTLQEIILGRYTLDNQPIYTYTTDSFYVVTSLKPKNIKKYLKNDENQVRLVYFTDEPFRIIKQKFFLLSQSAEITINYNYIGDTINYSISSEIFSFIKNNESLLNFSLEIDNMAIDINPNISFSLPTKYDFLPYEKFIELLKKK